MMMMTNHNGRIQNVDLPMPRGRMIRYDPNLDAIDASLTTGLTPKRAGALLTSADGGTLSDYLQLCEEITEKDPHLGSVVETRMNAILGLDWQIAPDHRSEDDEGAIEVAGWMADYFAGIESFNTLLRHNAERTATGLAVSEIVYGEGVDIIEFNPVSSTRLLANYDESKMIHIQRSVSDEHGAPADPSKYIVHMPHSSLGFPTRGAPMRAVILCWLAKNMAFKQWVQFVSAFGMPIPIAKYSPGADSNTKDEAYKLISNLTGARGGLLRDDVQLEFVTPAGGATPHEVFARFCNGEMSKRILGQKLTTETDGGTGTLAAAKVHENVRRDILQADVVAETRTMAPLMQRTARWWWGRNAPVPVFKRVVPDPVDYAAISQRMTAAATAGLSMSKKQIRALLDLEEPVDESDKLVPPAPSAAAAPFPSFSR